MKWLPYHHHHTSPVLWPFFHDHPGELVQEENFWTLWCKGRLTEADTPTNRTKQCPPPPFPHIFYRPDALPAAQPTVSKHWRHWSDYLNSRQARYDLFCVTSAVKPQPNNLNSRHNIRWCVTRPWLLCGIKLVLSWYPSAVLTCICFVKYWLCNCIPCIYAIFK